MGRYKSYICQNLYSTETSSTQKLQTSDGQEIIIWEKMNAKILNDSRYTSNSSSIVGTSGEWGYRMGYIF